MNNFTKTYGSQLDIVYGMIEQRFNMLWTALPGIIESFDPEQMTVEVQPALTFKIQGSNGKVVETPMPLLQDVPIVFPGSGGYQITIPIHKGDECLLIFNSRCIDSWWSNGNVQPQAQFRVNDISDAMAIPGVRSLPKTMSELGDRPYQNDRFEIRKDDGTAWISLEDNNNIDVQAYSHTANYETDNTVTIGGNVTVTIEGDSTLQVKGNDTNNIGGDYKRIVEGVIDLLTQQIVQIGDGTVQQTPFGQALMLWLNTHQHVTGAPGAPTSPAIVPATTAQFSQKVKTYA